MKLAATLILSIVLLVLSPFAASAQELNGKYRGDVTTRNNGDNAFELIIVRSEGVLSGSIEVFKGTEGCRGKYALTGTASSDGSARFSAPGREDNRYCDRTVTLKLQANGIWEGTIHGSMGVTGFKLTPKN